jgi:hypothetical protein
MGEAASFITLLHAASAAAMRQKLVQFATVLHIMVLHILQHQQPMVLGFRALQAQKWFEANGQQQHMHSSGSRSQC